MIWATDDCWSGRTAEQWRINNVIVLMTYAQLMVARAVANAVATVATHFRMLMTIFFFSIH